MSLQVFYILVACFFSALVGIWSYRRKSIATSGFIALICICTLFISLQAYVYLGILFSMFASSSLLTKYKKAQKEDMEAIVLKTGPRDAFQAFANLGAAIVSYVFLLLSQDMAWVYAFLGSVAASNADSWASEIGGLSNSPPRMITTFKLARKGISGAVTWLGTLGGIIGALFISVWAWVLPNMESLHPLSLFAIASIAGVFGFVLDSFLGALIQAKYIDSDGALTERIQGNRLRSGISWINNDVVNLISSIMAAVFGYAAFHVVS